MFPTTSPSTPQLVPDPAPVPALMAPQSPSSSKPNTTQAVTFICKDAFDVPDLVNHASAVIVDKAET